MTTEANNQTTANDAAQQRADGLVALAKLGIDATGKTEMRIDLLVHALKAGADTDTLREILSAVRVSPCETVTLPRGKYAHCSRGKDWCRQGRGTAAVWGELGDDGFIVGTGRWVVGSNDGFHRKSAVEWKVQHLTVGAETWTIAN